MTSAIRTTRQTSDAKRTGAHFTPTSLADFLASRLIASLAAWPDELRILDPSCGDGELLRAFAAATAPENRRLLRLVGVDDNASALTAARKKLGSFTASAKFIEGDFLAGGRGAEQLQFDVPVCGREQALNIDAPDVIIANPPYVRTQILGADRAQLLASKYNLRGRVDLYYAFLVAMTDALREDGLLGVITSNRFLSTRSGESVRQFLIRHYDLIEVIDLGDTKLFSAAVLPAIIIGRKRKLRIKRGATHTRFVKAYEVQPSAKVDVRPFVCPSVLSAIAIKEDGHYAVGDRVYVLTSGDLAVGSDPREPWRLATVPEKAWVAQVEQVGITRVADLAKVRVGIKTTADRVFIRADWSELPAEMQPEGELLRPLFTHFDAARWRASKPCSDLLQILYTHESINGKRRAVDISRYPRAARYLESNRDALSGRLYVAEASRKWYEIWVPQDPAAWALPKIVFPDISVEPRFFFDLSGTLVNGDCYWIACEPALIERLYLIQGVANSTVMTRYHDLAFNNKLYSGRRRYISQYIEKYPIPDPSSPIAKKIVAAVRALNERPSATGEALLEALVATAFGVSPVKN
ncbi:MAG: N-6 DNA methylase [Candidatus Eremiobacteraeota bacterium]|nr:N-6 DNA methylase [Candidatus Eremiobacteraeota bacterium]